METIGTIIAGIVGVGISIGAVMLAWAAFCLFLKGLFKIADWIF